MDIDRHWGIGLLVFGVIALLAFLIFVVGFSAVTRPMISDGAGSVGNYTSNTTHWTGFAQTFTSAPLLVFLIFGLMIAFAVWKLVSPHIRPKT